MSDVYTFSIQAIALLLAMTSNSYILAQTGPKLCTEVNKCIQISSTIPTSQWDRLSNWTVYKNLVRAVFGYCDTKGIHADHSAGLGSGQLADIRVVSSPIGLDIQAGSSPAASLQWFATNRLEAATWRCIKGSIAFHLKAERSLRSHDAGIFGFPIGKWDRVPELKDSKYRFKIFHGRDFRCI